MLKSISIFCNLRQKFIILFFFITQLIISILELITLSLIPIFILYLTDPKKAYSKIDNINNFISENLFQVIFFQSITSIFIIMAVLLLIKNFLQIFLSFTEGNLVKILNYQTITKVFNITLNQSLTKLISKKGSEYLRNINSESTQSVGYLMSQFLILKELLLLSFIILTLFLNNILTGLLSLIFIIIAGFLIFLFLNKKLITKGKASFITKSNLIEGITNYLNIIKEIKIYRLEKFFTNYFQKNLRIKLRNDLFKYLVSKLPRNIFEISIILIIIILSLVAKKTSIDFKEYLPLLGLTIIAFLRIIPVLSSINSSYAGLVYNYVSFQTIKKILLDKKNENKNILSKKDIFQIKNFRKIKFSNLNFKFNENKIFENFSFEINKDKIIGIIGPSGIGKSTLLNIITGILKVENLEIFIDGKILQHKEFEFGSVGYVSQSTFLINGSIIENIALGKNIEDLKNEKIKKIVDISGVKDLLEKSNLNLQSSVSDKGQNLSGGQIQRIGIARALYREPSFLLLDEATNQIDKKNKIQILEKLKNNYTNMTTIIVSHDQEITKYCDELIDLNV